MTSTLIVRPVSRCDLNHPLCPFSVGVSKEYEILHPKALEAVAKGFKGFTFDEAVVVCPNPLLHPRILDIIAALKRVGRKLSLFTPVTGLGKLSRDVLDGVDELVIVSLSIEELRKVEGRIKGLLSLGFENISVYAAVTKEELGILVTSEHVGFCRKYGIPLRVGELPYIIKIPLRLCEAFIEGGYEVSMPYGFMYGYRASVAFMKGYRVTILERPLRRACRTLFIDHYGRVSKCPFTQPTLELGLGGEGVASDELRKVLYSECPIKELNLDYVPEVRISLRAGKGVVIPPDILALLEVIESTGSLRAACRLLGYNPSTYVEKLRSIERRLGVKLVSSRRGGPIKGLTTLTDEGLRVVATYRRVREAIATSLIKESVYSFTLEY